MFKKAELPFAMTDKVSGSERELRSVQGSVHSITWTRSRLGLGDDGSGKQQ